MNECSICGESIDQGALDSNHTIVRRKVPALGLNIYFLCGNCSVFFDSLFLKLRRERNDSRRSE